MQLPCHRQPFGSISIWGGHPKTNAAWSSFGLPWSLWLWCSASVFSTAILTNLVLFLTLQPNRRSNALFVTCILFSCFLKLCELLRLMQRFRLPPKSMLNNQLAWFPFSSLNTNQHLPYKIHFAINFVHLFGIISVHIVLGDSYDSLA